MSPMLLFNLVTSFKKIGIHQLPNYFELASHLTLLCENFNNFFFNFQKVDLQFHLKLATFLNCIKYLGFSSKVFCFLSYQKLKIYSLHFLDLMKIINFIFLVCLKHMQNFHCYHLLKDYLDFKTLINFFRFELSYRLLQKKLFIHL